MSKQWTELLTLSSHSGDVTDFGFGRDSMSIVSAGMDRKVSVAGQE